MHYTLSWAIKEPQLAPFEAIFHVFVEFYLWNQSHASILDCYSLSHIFSAISIVLKSVLIKDRGNSHFTTSAGSSKQQNFLGFLDTLQYFQIYSFILNTTAKQAVPWITWSSCNWGMSTVEVNSLSNHLK